MSNTSDLLNGDVLLRSTDATSPATQAVSFGDTTPGTTTGAINVRGITERERMVQQIKTIADRLTSSLRGSADPGLTPQHELDLSRAIETETATARQDADETSVCLGQVSHDIRTRMTSILGYADLLLDTWLTDDQTMKVRGLKQATTSLLVVINELLDLSALEAGQLQIGVGPGQPSYNHRRRAFGRNASRRMPVACICSARSVRMCRNGSIRMPHVWARSCSTWSPTG